MKVLIASSEVHPYSKTGGLADMAGALGKSLAETGLEVTLMTPLYGGILERFPDIEALPDRIEVPLGSHRLRARILRRHWLPGLTVDFIQHTDFYERHGVYQEHGVDYADNAERFVFFCKCVMAWARRQPEPFAVVHAHDWQAGLLPLMIQHEREREGWGTAPRTCLTIHNLAYQGIFPASAYPLTNLPWDYFNPQSVEFYGAMNSLKAAICHADRITTVSPRYAREILTPEYGCGLDGVLRERRGGLRGILNGVDYTEWQTEKNPWLAHAYSVNRLRGKGNSKEELQKELGLPVHRDKPLFGNVSRLVHQKGSDLMLGALEEMLAADMQFVMLGSGGPELERAFQGLQHRHPDRVTIRIGYDHGLSHRIEAASDFFLMPSRFEPCGLNQMYSLRYGAVPVVRATGGLDDTIVDANEDPSAANGIKFRSPSVRALALGIRKALALYRAPRALRHFRKNGMLEDFSWRRTAAEYCGVYRELTAGNGKPREPREGAEIKE